MGGCLVLDELEGTAEKLLSFIQDNPGCHLRRIKRAMGISMGTVQYQLDKLEKKGRVTSTRRGLYKYYFPIGLFKDNEKDILEVLTHETARKILMFILEQKSPTQTDIVNNVRISARSISWHVGRLIALKIIREIRDGRYKRYELQDDDAKYILTLLRNYYPSIWDKWSMRVVEMFLSLSSSREIEPFEGLENAVALGIGIFSILLLALSITAYRKTGLKLTIYAIIIFALFAIQQTMEFLEDTFSSLDTPITDVTISSLTLAILVLFFLAIVRTKIT